MRIARPWSSSSSVIVSGGISRSTFSSRAAREHDDALVEAALLHRVAAVALSASSTPIISPTPRTSTHAGRRRAARRRSRASARSPSGDGPLVEALVLEHVERGERGRTRHRVAAEGASRGCRVGQRSMSGAPAMIPPSGSPEATPLANSTTSGVTPKRLGRERPAGAADAATAPRRTPAGCRASSQRSRRPRSHADRRHDVAALAEHRLDDHRRRRSRRRLQRRAARRAPPSARVDGAVAAVASGMQYGAMVHAAAAAARSPRGTCALAVVSDVARHRAPVEAPAGSAMIPGRPVRAGQLDGAVDGLGAACCRRTPAGRRGTAPAAPSASASSM